MSKPLTVWNLVVSQSAWLGRFTGILSAASLTAKSFNAGIVEAFAPLINLWREAVRFATDWITTPLNLPPEFGEWAVLIAIVTLLYLRSAIVLRINPLEYFVPRWRDRVAKLGPKAAYKHLLLWAAKYYGLFALFGPMLAILTILSSGWESAWGTLQMAAYIDFVMIPVTFLTLGAIALLLHAASLIIMYGLRFALDGNTPVPPAEMASWRLVNQFVIELCILIVGVLVFFITNAGFSLF